MPKSSALSFIATVLVAVPLSAQAQDDDQFLKFPIATDVSASDGSAVAWLVAQGPETRRVVEL